MKKTLIYTLLLFIAILNSGFLFSQAYKFVGCFYFVSTHGRVLQAHTDGEMHASQTVENVGLEERWNVFVWQDGQISLQNLKTNRWLCAEPNGKAICDREQPDIWEKWTLCGINNRVAFKSYHKTWLCAQPPGKDTEFGGEVIVNRTTCAEWERFSMIPALGPINNNSWWNTVQTAFKVAKEVVPILVNMF